MNKRKNEPISVPRRQRIKLLIVGMLFMLPGATALIGGTIFYTDYRNLLVFAPFSLLIGLVMIFFAWRVGRSDPR